MDENENMLNTFINFRNYFVQMKYSKLKKNKKNLLCNGLEKYKTKRKLRGKTKVAYVICKLNMGKKKIRKFPDRIES